MSHFRGVYFCIIPHYSSPILTCIFQVRKRDIEHLDAPRGERWDARLAALPSSDGARVIAPQVSELLLRQVKALAVLLEFCRCHL